jgi:hypothetical protein
LHTSKQAWCASGVAAAEVNAGVWFPPFGSVGMAAKQDIYINTLFDEGKLTESGMDRWQRCERLSNRSAHD